MNRISLTSSMRSNLLSLQNISRQVSSTQNKLATGNKVNSAIDNPSSYYTACTLNNRADDLNALLDSMGQAVSTIKAATTALEAGADFLEQAAAVATGALETAAVPAKSYFADKGTVVTTAQELKDAVNAGKETIIVYGKIDYFENEGIVLKDGQKLVGTEYFTGYTGREKFSKINFANTTDPSSYGIQPGNNSLVSDLWLTKTDEWKRYADVINIEAKNDVIINNVDIYTFNNNDLNNRSYSAITVSRSSAKLTGNINIRQERTENISASYADFFSINLADNALLDIEANVNIKSDGVYSWAFSVGLHNAAVIDVSTLNIKTGSVINVQNSEEAGFNIGIAQGTMFNVESGVVINSNKEHRKNDYFNLQEGAIFNYDPDLDFGEGFPYDFKPGNQTSQSQYNQIINQYDQLIKDASYKGINLLQEDRLGVKFNESGSAALEVKGRNMSSATLGLQTIDWQTQGDIAQSLKEISAALKSIRSFSAELGNNYSIITSRQDFTENLINILTEGADKLTLADMNEESANMLALQTRQQLAINSLSLASQTNQAVLKLF